MCLHILFFTCASKHHIIIYNNPQAFQAICRFNIDTIYPYSKMLMYVRRSKNYRICFSPNPLELIRSPPRKDAVEMVVNVNSISFRIYFCNFEALFRGTGTMYFISCIAHRQMGLFSIFQAKVKSLHLFKPPRNRVVYSCI